MVFMDLFRSIFNVFFEIVGTLLRILLYYNILIIIISASVELAIVTFYALNPTLNMNRIAVLISRVKHAIEFWRKHV